MKKPILVAATLAIAASTVLFLAGCGGGDHADHSEDGHSHADAEHDHAAAGHDDHGDHTEAAGVEAGTITEAAGLTIVENPTAGQLAGTREYPLETCPTSGEKLGDMGEPLLFLVGGQQVKLCCKDCIADLKADPAKVLAGISK